MQVKELITRLQEFDPDSLVVIQGYESGFDDFILKYDLVKNVGKKKEQWWNGKYQTADHGRHAVLFSRKA